jgi:hypothetical protein
MPVKKTSKMVRRKPKELAIFNPTLTIEEGRKLRSFKGTASYPDTKHNRDVMRKLIDDQLRKLQGK